MFFRTATQHLVRMRSDSLETVTLESICSGKFGDYFEKSKIDLQTILWIIMRKTFQMMVQAYLYFSLKWKKWYKYFQVIVKRLSNPERPIWLLRTSRRLVRGFNRVARRGNHLPLRQRHLEKDQVRYCGEFKKWRENRILNKVARTWKFDGFDK